MRTNDQIGSGYLIRRERPEDYLETETLVREAFWNVYRPGCTEHYVLHCFRPRKEFIPELDLVMVMGGRITGQIMYVHSKIDGDDGSEIPAFTFGPVSIHPDYQGRGLGRKLIDCSIGIAEEMGAGALVITGSGVYYGGSGFVPAKTVGIRYREDPEADYLLVRELRKGYLDGVSGTFSDPEGYLAAVRDPEGFERFDSRFPKKEKKKLPGQLDLD